MKKIRQDKAGKALPPSSQQQSAGALENVQSPTKTNNVTGSGGKPPIHSRRDRESSPTSVVSPVSNAGPQSLATPRVFMVDEGAEVSLNTPPQQRTPLADRTNIVAPAVTPENTRRPVHMNSLLDADISPNDENREQHSLLDAHITPNDENNDQHRPSLGAQMLCGGSGPDCFSTSDDTDGCALVNAPQASVERTITLLLGDPAGFDFGWCHAWQAWIYFGSEHCSNHDENARETKEDMKRVLRNRAYDLNSRNRRIRSLKCDLSPFDASPPKVSVPIPLAKTRSFSNIELENRTRSSSDTSLNVSVVSLSAVWDSMPGCGQPDSDSPAVLRSRDLVDDLCYDSDPEEITRRRPRLDKKESPFMAFNGSKNSRAQEEAASRNSDLVVPRRLDAIFKDDDHAKDVVQEFMNEKLTLVWHRSVKPDVRSKGTPQTMLIWIERGQQLNSGLIQPKLVWRPVKDHEETHRLGLVTPTLESLELLDISRILEVNRIDRKLYPFAKRKSCFLVESLDRKMMFEASSETERDRIVNGLKLLVARFASKVIVQDRQVLDEFFTSFLSAVPGEAPRWATQESKTLSIL